MAVVFILVDALRSDYLTHHQTAPFLSYCSENGVYVERVRPSLGFCERVEILTGVGFPENGYLSAIGRKKRYLGPHSLLKALPPGLIRNDFFRKVLCKIRRRLKVRLRPYEIPIEFLPELMLTEDAKNHQKPLAFDVESLVDVFAEAGKKISWHFAALGLNNGTDEDRIDALKEAFSRDEADLYMLYLSPLDITAHRHGPHSSEVATSLGKVDRQIQSLFEFMTTKDPDSVLMVLGDHGMANVGKTIDAERALAKASEMAGLRPWRDFKYFLDSTACRIWGETRRFEEKEEDFIRDIEGELGRSGSWLDGVWDKALYGDHVWVCNEGILVFPDFFHRDKQAYKGMHGYSPENLSMHGVGLIYSMDTNVLPKKITEGHLCDVANTLCDLVGVRPPVSSRGESWVKSMESAWQGMVSNGVIIDEQTS